MKIYQIIHLSSYCSHGGIEYTTTDKAKVQKEFLDIVHYLARDIFDTDVPEYFLAEEYNGQKDLEHINEWEELAEEIDECRFYNHEDESFNEYRLIEIEVRE